MSRLRMGLSLIAAALISTTGAALAPSAEAAAPSCSTSGTWRQGELNVYWFDVEQGDSQLVVGPTGKTMLIDLGETAWNSTGTGTNATKVAAQIRSICGIASGPVHLDYVMASHQHLDHIGYSGNPNDTQSYGNGLWQLLAPAGSGGLGFEVGQLIDHDGGVWNDVNGDGSCQVGTSTSPADEVTWHNVGTTSTTATRWICWLYGPTAQADRANINGKVLRLTNPGPWPTIDMGGGASAAILNANAYGTKEADGTTTVSGDHHADAVPPSENDYSIAVKFTFGTYKYATAGDSDGEYSTSANGYSYNNIEAGLAPKIGDVDTVRANHHGSAHSSSLPYLQALTPATAFISCGANSYGHPGNQTLNNYRTMKTDVYLANDPCDTTDTTGAAIDYSGTFNHNGTVHLATTGAGAGYTVDYDAGERTYTSGVNSGGGTTGDPTQVKVNEVMMAPSTGNEWIELYNPTAQDVNLTGYSVDDAAGGGGAPKAIPSGTVIPAGGRYVMDVGTSYLNNTGAESARYLKVEGTVETVYDTYSWSLGSTQYDKVFHRSGDGGAWCNTISANVTKGTANPTTCP